LLSFDTLQTVNIPPVQIQLNRVVPSYRVQLPVSYDVNNPLLNGQDNMIQFNRDSSDNQCYARCLLTPTFDTPFCSSPHGQVNQECALRKRIGPEMPLGNFFLLQRLALFVDAFILEWLKPLPNLEINEDCLFEEWLLSCSHYNESRKDSLRRARSSRLVNGSVELLPKDYFIKCFFKREFYEEPKFARLINPRSDCFKSAVGPYIHLIEEQVYKLPWFVKGVPITSLPTRLSRLEKYPIILETDYSSFEAGFSPEYVACVEMRLWKFMLQNNPRILSIINKVYFVDKNGVLKPRENMLFHKDFIMRVIGRRMSGEMWTSLANGFSNLMNVLFLAKENHQDIDGFVEGDDGLFGMYEPFLNADMFAQLGFKIKMNYGYDLNHTSFCGNVFDKDEQLLIVNPENIARLFWTCTVNYLNARPSKLLQLLRGKAMSLYCIAKNTPISSVLAYSMLKLLGPGPILIDPNRKWWRSQLIASFKSVIIEEPIISMKSRALFCEKYGISIEFQYLMEKYIRNAKCLDELAPQFYFMNQSYDEGRVQISRL